MEDVAAGLHAYDAYSMTATLVTADNGPHNMPGTVQAEDYDVGGPCTSYNIAGQANGSQSGYRSDNNENVATGSGSGGNGYQLGWNYAGEYYKYIVNVAQKGTYSAKSQYSAGGPGGTFHVADENNRNLTGPLTVQNTYSWSTFCTVTSPPFMLPAGQTTLKLVEDTNGPCYYVGNFDCFTISTVAVSPSNASFAPPSVGTRTLRSQPKW